MKIIGDSKESSLSTPIFQGCVFARSSNSIHFSDFLSFFSNRRSPQWLSFRRQCNRSAVIHDLSRRASRFIRSVCKSQPSRGWLGGGFHPGSGVARGWPSQGKCHDFPRSRIACRMPQFVRVLSLPIHCLRALCLRRVGCTHT